MERRFSIELETMTIRVHELIPIVELYSLIKEAWVENDEYIKYPFPIMHDKDDAEQVRVVFTLINGWKLLGFQNVEMNKNESINWLPR